MDYTHFVVITLNMQNDWYSPLKMQILKENWFSLHASSLGLYQAPRASMLPASVLSS